MEEDKILKGEEVILEVKDKLDTENKTYNIEEFRDLIGYQDNVGIMSNCITLLAGNQIYDGSYYYRLVKGRKLVVNMFEEYAHYFVDAENWIIELEGEI